MLLYLVATPLDTPTLHAHDAIRLEGISDLAEVGTLKKLLCWTCMKRNLCHASIITTYLVMCSNHIHTVHAVDTMRIN